jgi:outer membrane protein insertion porin family
MATALLLLAAAANPCISAAEDSAANPRVNDIEVRGLVRIDEGVIYDRISPRIGEPLDTKMVTGDIHALYGTGYFQDVSVDVEPFEGGLRVIYVVKEKPTIRRVETFGNEKVLDEDLRDAISISPGAVADMVLIQENVRNLKSVYERKRYPLAQIVPVIRRVTEGHVLLTFHIREGSKVKIDNIFIEGNEKVDDEDVADVMKTSEYWVLSWLSGGGKYSKEVLDEDLRRVSDLYHDQGYIKSEVLDPVVEYKKFLPEKIDRAKKMFEGSSFAWLVEGEPSEENVPILKRKRDMGWMDITIRVVEGNQYTLGNVDFEGNVLYRDEDLMPDIVVEQGELVSRSRIREDVERITDQYTTEGYALASVFPDIRPDDETLRADMTYRVREGDIYNVGRIDITGNQKTRDRVIRREIRLNEGEKYNGKKLKRSFQMLANLNYFEDIRLDPMPDQERKTLNIGVKVLEKPTGSFNIGGGYSTVDRFVGMVDITFGNFRGAGQILKIGSQFSSRSTTYSVSFTEPWLFGRPISMTTSVFRNKREFTEYTKISTGFSLGLGYRFWEYWKIGASYGYRLDKITDIDDDADQKVLDMDRRSVQSSISPYITRDTRDNFLNPHSGSRNSLSVFYAGLGGDKFFVKANADSSWIFPVSKNTEFNMRGRYGYASGLYGHGLPLYERYYVGGPYSVRGMRRLGPVDDDGDYVGGRQRLVFNFDYTFPLIKEAGLKGDIFYDTGTAFDSEIEMRDSAGAGFRWVTPIGPLMFFWAKNLHQRYGEPEHRWEFAIGSLF